MVMTNVPQWSFEDKYLEHLCKRAWNKLPNEVRNKATLYVNKVSDDGDLTQHNQGTTYSESNPIIIAKFNPNSKDIQLFQENCVFVSDEAVVGAFVHEVAHAVKTAALTDKTNPYFEDAVEHAGDALPSGWFFSKEISALISERAQIPSPSPFSDSSRSILSQALVSFAAGFLFLKSFSNNPQFLFAGLITVLLSVVFLAAALGSVVKRLRRLRALSIRYGTNLWFALMIISLARIVISWGSVPSITLEAWLSNLLVCLAPIWILLFSIVFITLAISQTVYHVKYFGKKRGITDMFVSLSWTLGVFGTLLIILTDINIKWAIAMIGAAVVCLASVHFLQRESV